MSRGTKVLPFDLADATRQPQSVDRKHVKVTTIPAEARDLVRLFLDDEDHGIVAPGDVFRACAGGTYSKIALQAPVMAGTVEVVCSNDDSIPFPNARPAVGGACTLRRLMEWLYLPHQPWQDNVGGFPLNGLAMPGGIVTQMWTVEGNEPDIVARGHRCVRMKPAGGSSSALSAFSLPWQRKVVEPGARGATIISRLTPRIVSCKVSVNLSTETTVAKSTECGLQFAQGRGTGENFAGGNAGFAIVRDGVAGAGAWWLFVARDGDANPLSITAALPRPAGATVLTPTRFAVEITEADPIAGRDGIVSVYVNDELAQQYADMDDFPPAADLVDSTGLDLRLIDEGATVNALRWSRFRLAVDASVNGDE